MSTIPEFEIASSLTRRGRVGAFSLLPWRTAHCRGAIGRLKNLWGRGVPRRLKEKSWRFRTSTTPCSTCSSSLGHCTAVRYPGSCNTQLRSSFQNLRFHSVSQRRQYAHHNAGLMWFRCSAPWHHLPRDWPRGSWPPVIFSALLWLHGPLSFRRNKTHRGQTARMCSSNE